MTLPRFLGAGLILTLTAAASTARENADAVRSVQQLVQDRSGKDARWEKDQAAREQALEDARRLLRKPLTIDAALQIALLNNRSL